jgi:undecaprenyl-diphosphatase
VLYRNYGKLTLKFFPVILVMITLTDQLSTLMKNTTERLRPCHEPALDGLVHLVNNKCGGQFGFVSSHAANTVALAFFIIMMLPRGYKNLRLELIAFALINIYSRVYLGAHYPLDVLCGAFLGYLIGLICITFMRNLVNIPSTVAKGHE